MLSHERIGRRLKLRDLTARDVFEKETCDQIPEEQENSGLITA